MWEKEKTSWTARPFPRFKYLLSVIFRMERFFKYSEIEFSAVMDPFKIPKLMESNIYMAINLLNFVHFTNYRWPRWNFSLHALQLLSLPYSLPFLLCNFCILYVRPIFLFNRKFVKINHCIIIHKNCKNFFCCFSVKWLICNVAIETNLSKFCNSFQYTINKFIVQLRCTKANLIKCSEFLLWFSCQCMPKHNIIFRNNTCMYKYG